MWDPKVYFFHNGPLKNTDAALEEVILACESALAISTWAPRPDHIVPAPKTALVLPAVTA